MKILTRYILLQFVRNFFASLISLTILFLIVDFFDRIDNIAGQDASFGVVIQYFMLKVPLMVSLMLPLSMLASTIFTIGILSKSSELTAMRAAGVTILTLGKPLFIFGICVSIFAIALNEGVVPYSTRRVRELYNIDIMQKDKSGRYSKDNFWWRDKSSFYTASLFDSRSNSFHHFSQFHFTPEFELTDRYDSKSVNWIDPLLGWNMQGVTEFRFAEAQAIQQQFHSLPLPITRKPSDFYDSDTDPFGMSFLQLRKFIRQQRNNGVDVTSYWADLYDKLAFPFISTVLVLVVYPFMVRPARTAAFAKNAVVGILFGFAYYALHSFSIAFGRADLLPPLMSAWVANGVMVLVGLILIAGAEAPS